MLPWVGGASRMPPLAVCLRPRSHPGSKFPPLGEYPGVSAITQGTLTLIAEDRTQPMVSRADRDILGTVVVSPEDYGRGALNLWSARLTMTSEGRLAVLRSHVWSARLTVGLCSLETAYTRDLLGFILGFLGFIFTLGWFYRSSHFSSI